MQLNKVTLNNLKGLESGVQDFRCISSASGAFAFLFLGQGQDLPLLVIREPDGTEYGFVLNFVYLANRPYSIQMTASGDQVLVSCDSDMFFHYTRSADTGAGANWTQDFEVANHLLGKSSTLFDNIALQENGGNILTVKNHQSSGMCLYPQQKFCSFKERLLGVAWATGELPLNGDLVAVSVVDSDASHKLRLMFYTEELVKIGDRVLPHSPSIFVKICAANGFTSGWIVIAFTHQLLVLDEKGSLVFRQRFTQKITDMQLIQNWLLLHVQEVSGTERILVIRMGVDYEQCGSVLKQPLSQVLVINNVPCLASFLSNEVWFNSCIIDRDFDVGSMPEPNVDQEAEICAFQEIFNLCVSQVQAKYRLTVFAAEPQFRQLQQQALDELEQEFNQRLSSIGLNYTVDLSWTQQGQPFGFLTKGETVMKLLKFEDN